MNKAQKMKSKNMVQSAVWLPIALHAELAKTGPRNLAKEIRRRLVEWQMFYDAGYRIQQRIVTEITTHEG